MRAERRAPSVVARTPQPGAKSLCGRLRRGSRRSGRTKAFGFKIKGDVADPAMRSSGAAESAGRSRAALSLTSSGTFCRSLSSLRSRAVPNDPLPRVGAAPPPPPGKRIPRRYDEDPRRTERNAGPPRSGRDPPPSGRRGDGLRRPGDRVGPRRSPRRDRSASTVPAALLHFPANVRRRRRRPGEPRRWHRAPGLAHRPHRAAPKSRPGAGSGERGAGSAAGGGRRAEGVGRRAEGGERRAGTALRGALRRPRHRTGAVCLHRQPRPPPHSYARTLPVRPHLHLHLQRSYTCVLQVCPHLYLHLQPYLHLSGVCVRPHLHLQLHLHLTPASKPEPIPVPTVTPTPTSTPAFTPTPKPTPTSSPPPPIQLLLLPGPHLYPHPKPHTHTCLYTCTSASTLTSNPLPIFTPTPPSTYAHTYTQTHTYCSTYTPPLGAHLHPHLHTPTPPQTPSYTHTYSYTQTHRYTHIDAHTRATPQLAVLQMPPIGAFGVWGRVAAEQHCRAHGHPPHPQLWVAHIGSAQPGFGAGKEGSWGGTLRASISPCWWWWWWPWAGSARPRRFLFVQDPLALCRTARGAEPLLAPAQSIC